MAPRSFFLGDDLAGYVAAHCPAPDDVQSRLIEETRSLGDLFGMQISADEGSLLTLLARLTGARHAIELGTFTGYSAICIARGLQAGGRLVCCDLSEEWTSIARRYWKEAGVEAMIDLRLGPAAETVRSLPAEPTFDLAFIDADKPAYPAYWELVVPRMRPGGLILADNVFRHGAIVDPDAGDEGTVAMRRFNDTVAADGRTDAVMLSIADGLTLARVR